MDHFLLEGIGGDIWSFLKTDISKKYPFFLNNCNIFDLYIPPHEAGKIYEALNARFTALGEHKRIVRFINGVIQLALKASKDISGLLDYLVFVMQDMLCM